MCEGTEMKKIFLLILLNFISYAQLETVWVKRFFSPFDFADFAIDNFNNIILTTYPYIRKLNPDGEILWQDSVYLGNASPAILCVATDTKNNIIVGGIWSQYPYADFDTLWVIFKFNPFGQVLWQETIPFPGLNYYSLTDIAVDKENNIIIVGGTSGTGRYGFWLIFKYSENGELMWERRYTSDWGPDCATGVCCDNFNNVIVTGYRGVFPRPRQWFPQVIKYSRDGDSLWSHAYVPEEPENRYAGRPAVDKFDNIIMVGGDGVFKYAPDGSKLWNWHTSSVPQPAASHFFSAVTDSNDNIFVIGSRAEPRIVEIWKLTPQGETVYRFQFPFSVRYLAPFFLLLDKEGNLITAIKPREDRNVYLFKLRERISEIKEKVIKKPLSLRRRIYDIKGNLIEEKRLKKGIYFLNDGKKINKILILK